MIGEQRLITRRDVLRTGAATLAGFGLVATRPTKALGRIGPTGGATASDLHLRLRSAPTEATITSGLRTPVWSYSAAVISGDRAAVVPSGSFLGPTLRLRQGQRVRVTFENRLPQSSIVHWHGLHLPQMQDGQPDEAIASGANYEYDFVVDADPGTYWYHPHPHMQTGEQVYRGLAGMIHVIGNEPNGLPTKELNLVLQDRSFAADGTLRYLSSMHDAMMGFVGDTLVTNGVSRYRANVSREPYRMRILNGANSRTQRLTLSGDGVFTVLATDGHLLPSPVRTRQLVLSPAQRADVWIDFSSLRDGASVELRTADLFVEGRGLGAIDSRTDVAATFTANGPPRRGVVPTRLGAAPRLRASDAVNTNRPKEFVLSTRRMAHWINGRVWEGRNVTALETVRANTIELWDFVNFSPIPHPIHLHGRAFRVLDRSWDDDTLAADWRRISAGVIETGWRDTVLVWPGQRVRLGIPFGDHLGYFPYHCHILEHEDAGMMRSFRIV